jgi:hypothetical protein
MCISLTIYPRLDDGMDVSQENGPWHPDPDGRGIVPLSSFQVFLRIYWPTGTQGVPSVSKATWVYFGVWVRLTNHKRHRENVNARCGATLNASPWHVLPNLIATGLSRIISGLLPIGSKRHDIKSLTVQHLGFSAWVWRSQKNIGHAAARCCRPYIVTQYSICLV